ncbi:glycosyl transferase [Kitasatospora sp. MMS16-BH015]|uniref:glycosyltransferase n=1 Tax=Kitasatospora sp. MMS16-BH015 TaxID=2018025 RepID=UPI000CA2332F|nr:glycosyltransferase [Kitasatospora sp. MMS16-BH015]AUG81745.1 glycosyl transferase [Kitasatospora sp. MMS16-BH015]
MIGALAVVVPARDEEELLPGCLQALRRAARHPGVPDLPVLVTVVADGCTDDTVRIAHHHEAQVVELTGHNVGAARAAGCARALLAAGELVPGIAPDRVWLAQTDADSQVPPDWIVRHLAFAVSGWHALAGTVRVADWRGHPRRTAAAFARHYRADGRGSGGHAHVHGANLGVRADAYQAVGGFRPVAVGEDRVLVAALDAAGYRIGRTVHSPVTTSGRRVPRARGGFGDFLRGLDARAG